MKLLYDNFCHFLLYACTRKKDFVCIKTLFFDRQCCSYVYVCIAWASLTAYTLYLQYKDGIINMYSKRLFSNRICFEINVFVVFRSGTMSIITVLVRIHLFQYLYICIVWYTYFCTLLQKIYAVHRHLHSFRFCSCLSSLCSVSNVSFIIFINIFYCFYVCYMSLYSNA